MKRLLRTLDFWICIALAALTIAYLRTWPHDFLQADEGTFLYEAKRVLAGDVIYRDFFEVIPTGIKQAGLRDPINTYLRAKYRLIPISATPSLTHRLWERVPDATR